MDGAGLVLCSDVDMRLNHDDLGLESSRSVEPSLPDVKGRSLPNLLTELSLDCVRPSAVEARSGSRIVFRLKRDVDEGAWATGGCRVTVAGCETVRRGKDNDVDGLGEYETSEPGAFLLPGFVKTISPSVPRARPAAATPIVLKAQS